MGKNSVEMPEIDEGSEGAKILAAFRDQTPIVIDGRKCIVTDAHLPKGEDDLRYRVRWID